MTDFKIGDKLLLRVSFNGYLGSSACVVSDGYRTMLTNPLDVATLFPADRITELEAEVARLRKVEAGAQGVSRALEIHGYPVSEAAWENTGEIMSAEARQLHLAAVFLNRALNPKGDGQ